MAPNPPGRDKGPDFRRKTLGLKSRATEYVSRVVPPEARWNLAFVGLLSYLFIEYTRLPEMYPILRPLELGKVVFVVTVAGWLTSGTVGAQRSGSRKMDIAVAVFLFACLASAVFAEDHVAAFDGALAVLRWALIYFLISRILISTWRLRIFTMLLLLLCLKLSQFEVRSYLSDRSFGRSDMFLSMHGVGAGSTGFFGNGGDFGVAMCVVWPLAGVLLAGESKKLTRIFLFTCFVTFLISIFLCGSRGAVVGAAAVALFAWAKQPKRIIGVLMIIFLAVGSYFILPEATKERLAPTLHLEQDDTSQMRLDLWRAGIDMFERHPLLGVGLGNFGHEYWSEYGGKQLTPTVYAPHSIYIQALSETGLVGVIPLLVVWVLFLRVNADTRRRLRALNLANRKSLEYRLSVGLDLAFAGYMVSGAFLTVLFYPHLWYLLGMCVGLHGTCVRKQPETVAVESEKQERKLALATY
jgi:O-antigen ligase